MAGEGRCEYGQTTDWKDIAISEQQAIDLTSLVSRPNVSG